MARRMAMPTRRFGSSTGGAHKEKTFTEEWLSDAGAYPVIIIISGACVFCAGVCTWNLVGNKDVRWDKKKRMSTIRFWD
tara:strand:+ start:213 stop:449 length:237 start_codon:yes stop_codon:yes gene_type:complete